MSDPSKGPPGFQLSKDWWESGSAIRAKTVNDVFAALGVANGSPLTRKAAARAFYTKHPDKERLVPKDMRADLGLG